MCQEEIKSKLMSLINEIRPDLVNAEGHLFNTKNNVQPVEMIYLLLAIRDTFGVVIDDAFVERIRDLNVSNLAEAITGALQACANANGKEVTA